MDIKGISLLERNINKLSKQYGITEKSAIDFMTGVKDGSIVLKDGQTILSGYQSYLKSTAKATDLANLKTKALTISMKALSTVGWMAIMAGVSMVISKVVSEFDNYIHRVDNAKEALESSKQTYETSAEKIKDLNTQLEECNEKIQVLEQSRGVGELVQDDDYNDLVSTREELERIILLEKEAQRLNAIDLAEKARAVYDVRVDSNFKEYPEVSADGYVISTTQVLPVEELRLALDEYKKLASEKDAIDKKILDNASARSKIENTESKEYKKLVSENEKLTKVSGEYAAKLDETSKRASEMYTITDGLASSYKLLASNGTVLTAEQQDLLVNTNYANAGYLDLLSTINQVSVATDEMANGQNSASSSIVKTAGDMKTLNDEVDTVIASYTALNSAIADQKTGKSVELTEELEGYESCLEYVNGTMQINSEKARELAKAKADEKLATIEAQDALEKAKYLENSRDIARYTELLGDNKSVLVDGITVTEDYIRSLKDSNNQIVTNCDQYSLYASQIRQATGAYQEWLDSQNASESGTMFTDAGNATKAIQEGLMSGKVGTKKYKAAVEFLVPDSIDSTNETAVKSYLAKLERYLSDNGSGINNFISDATAYGLIEGTENGLSQVAKGKTVQDFANTLKITPEMARAIFGELEEYGWEFNWESEGIGDIETTLFESKQIVQDLKDDIAEKTDLGVNTDEAQKALKDAQSVYDELASKIVSPVDATINTDEFQKKLNEIKTLEDEISQASSHGGDFGNIGEAQGKLESLKLELQEISGLNTITVEAYVDGAQLKLDELEEKLRHFPSASAAAAEVEKEIGEVKGNLEIVQTLKIEKDPSVDSAKKDLQDVQEFKFDNKSFEVIANTSVAMSRLNAVKTALDKIRNTTISPNVKPSVGGSARANGSDGTSKTETALIGELGRELVVNRKTGTWKTYGENGAEFASIPKDSIIFNNEQTEKLLKRGFVNGRGSAYVNGTAYGSGGGTLSGGGKTKVSVSGDNTVYKNSEKLAKASKQIEKSAKKAAESAEKSEKATEKEAKEFDWIKTALDYISREREKIADIVGNENVSYQKQLSAAQELLAIDEQMITTNRSALENYQNQWDEIKVKILEAFGADVGNSLIAKIMQGDVSLQGWKDSFEFNSDDKVMSDKADIVDDAKGVYDSLIDQDNAYSEALKKKSEDQQRQFEIRVNMVKAYLDEVESEMNNAESDLNLKETTGRMVTESDYRNLINLSRDQIDLYYDQIDILEEQLDELEEGSAEWYNTKSQIASCDNEIRQCEKDQADWNEEILNLPIRRIERYLEILENIKKDMTNKIDEQEGLGIDATKDQIQSLIDISAKQVYKLKEQHDELSNKLNSYEYGSDKFNETANAIQDCEDEISSLIQSQNDWNKQILQIPINKIEELNGKLSNISDALTGVTDTYDTAIGSVVNVIEDEADVIGEQADAIKEQSDAVKKQIDAINDLKDITTKDYESKIKPYQDELDLLKEQNEERKIQFDLEQAAWDLEKAKNQKSNKVVRDGEIVYEANDDALRSANKAKADAEYNKTVYDLEKKISDLEAEREKILEGYDDEIDGFNKKIEEYDELLENYDKEIEKLDKIKGKWSEIAENIQKAKDGVIADEVLGDGWEEKVLSGQDSDLYEMMKQNYENMSAQKDLYDKQIDTNEKLSTLMQQYLDALQNGEMTFSEVSSKFDELINSAKDGFSALDNLNAILGVTGDKDLDSALGNIQDDINTSYGDFKDYISAAQKNSDTIAQYTQTWEEIKNAVVEQLEFLKKQAEEEANRVSNSNKGSSSGGSGHRGGGSSSGGPDWSTPDGPATGPAKEIEDREKAKRYKKGIENGIVGKASGSDKQFEMIQSMAMEKLKPNEIPSILDVGEYVINPEQSDMILKNISGMQLFHNIVSITPDFSKLRVQNEEKVVNFKMGDINLNSVDNTADLVNALSKEFDPAMRQAFSKY